jgi:hypothetical protein
MKCSRNLQVTVMGLAVLITLFFISGACTGGEVSKHKQIRKEPVNAMAQIYYKEFADSRRSSSIDLGSSAKGELAWEKPLYDSTEEPFVPKVLLSGPGYLFAYSDSLLRAYSADGVRLWTEKTRFDSPIAVHEDKVYFRRAKDQINLLAARALDGAAIAGEIYLLNTLDHAYPILIEPVDDAFYALCRYQIGPQDGPPYMIAYKKEYSTKEYIWAAGMDDSPSMPPLLIPELDRLVVFGIRSTTVFNTMAKEDKEQVAHFDYPLEKLFASSADAQGNLYLTGLDKGSLVLLSLGLDGKENWRWTGTYRPQLMNVAFPPVIGKDGLICLVTGASLKGIKAGQVVFDFVADKEAVNYCTSLADGTLLVAAGKSLYRLDADGKQQFRVVLAETIVAPPVIGSDGSIYAVTTKSLVHID